MEFTILTFYRNAISNFMFYHVRAYHGDAMLTLCMSHACACALHGAHSDGISASCNAKIGISVFNVHQSIHSIMPLHSFASLIKSNKKKKNKIKKQKNYNELFQIYRIDLCIN